jgi:hypothetical protein
MDLNALTNSLAHISFDWLIFAAVAILVAFDVARSGPARAIALTLALPIGGLFMQYLQTARFISPLLSQFPDGLPLAALTLAVIVASFFLMYRMTSSFSGHAGLLNGIIAGLAVAVVFATIWTQLPALAAIWQFNVAFVGLFGAAYRFWWLLVAFLALSFIRS